MPHLHRIVVVGASLAGSRAAEALRQAGFDGHLTIVGAEPHPPYNRPPLSKQLLLGKQTPQDVALPLAENLRADWRLGAAAQSLNQADRTVTLAGGERLPYDGLVLATGLLPRRPTVPGADLAGVHVLRTLDDALAVRRELRLGTHVVVVGAGFVGCEVASACRALGCEVTIVDTVPVPLGRVLGSKVGTVVAELHQENGVRLLLGRAVAAFEGDRRVQAVRLADGSRIRADVVVAGLGARPATDWLIGSGLDLSDGVACDDRCLAVGGEGRVVAAGDVASWPHPGYGGRRMRVEHWSQAVDQAEAAARALVSPASVEPFSPVLSFWSDQHRQRLQAVGAPWLADRFEITDGSLAERRFVAAYWSVDRLVGAVTMNMPGGLAAYRSRLIASMANRAGETCLAGLGEP